MSPARRRAPRQSSSVQPQLLVPRAQLDSELGERITLGEQLLGRTLRDKVELRAARQEYYSWTEYNEVLIKRSFDSTEPAEDCSRLVPVFLTGGPDPFTEQTRDFLDDVQSKVRRLHSLRLQLPLFPEHPDLAHPASPGESTGGTDVFVVHGHDGEAKQTVAASSASTSPPSSCLATCPACCTSGSTPREPGGMQSPGRWKPLGST